jgi:uncharacterized lipoprotein YddW (UPF0748 family)
MRVPRRRAGVILVVTVSCHLALLPAGSPAQAPEFRALWATRFEWPDQNEIVCKAKIDALMAALASVHFNAVFFQVRGQADVLYPSPYEVWSPLIGGQDPGWDPLAYAIASAHAQGLEFHAYINTHTCWQSVPAPAQTLPADPNHVLYSHCHAANPDARDWLHHDDAIHPSQFNESWYVWFAPGVPGYQAYIREQVLYVVQNYDVDGVHFDRIRTPGYGQPSWDAISRARFLAPRTNPAGLDFTAWTADQITRTVSDIYAAIVVAKPNVKVSAAVYPDPDTAPVGQHQDAIAWAQAGAMDMLVPMMYSAGGEGSLWDSRLQTWLARTAGLDVHVVPGHSAGQGLGSLSEQINLTRLRGGAGNSVFSWSAFNWWGEYASGAYLVPVATPTMPWKDSPDMGILYGHVTAPDGKPVLDAQVHLSGHDYTALSGADGFYAFLQVTPGAHALSAAHQSCRSVTLSNVVVGPGGAIRAELMFTEYTPPGDFNGDGDLDQADVEAFLFCLAGPSETFASGHLCTTADADSDADVDMADLAVFQERFGSGSVP